MSFLAPWALLLGAAAAVPILLHLLRRKSATKVEFPAIRYLERAQKEHAAEVRLRNLALMVVRVAIVLSVALAAARPLGWLPGGGHAPTAVAIVLDSTLSTGAAGPTGTTMSRLMDAAAQVQAAATRDDAVTIVPFARADGAAQAIARAQALLRADERPARSLVVLTDAQASTWANVPRDSAGAIATTLFVVPPPAIANRALTALELEPAIWSPRGAVRATVAASAAPGASHSEFGDVAWRVLIDERSVARGSLTQPSTFTARAEPASRGWLAGRVELAPDELRGDDVRHFAVHVGDAPIVALDDQAGRYLRGAMDALVEAGRVRLRGGPFVGSAVRARAPGLFFAPLDPLDIPTANRALQRANVPWRFGLRRTGNAPLRGDGLDGATALQWYALEPQAGAAADTLVRVGTAPWAVAGEGYVLVASAPDPAATTLPLAAPFVPWLDRILSERVAASGGTRLAAAPGAPYRVPAGVTSLEAPDQSLHPLSAGDMAAAPLVPGVYFFRRGTARAGALVVNAEPAESDLTTLPPDSLAAALGNVRVATSVERLSRLAYAATGARAMDASLLWLALALLLVETLLARRSVRAANAD